jgi:ABC-type antimicrobial peptide transport system permease subunit
MFRNYFKIAFRNLSRNKGFSAINIIGLAIGMASALLILLWVQNERSIDRSYPNADRLYLLYNRDTIDHTIWAWNQTPKSIAPILKENYSAVEDASRYRDFRFLLTVGDKSINSDGAYADSGFIKMFGFPMLQGDPALALAGPNDIVLTDQTAKRLFGSRDPMGRIVRINNSDEFTVSGVLKDLSSTTSFHFDYLVPWLFMTHQGWNDEQNWGNNSVYTYVLLRHGVSEAAFNTQVENITRQHSNVTAKVFGEPMTRLHLYGTVKNGKLVADQLVTVRLFSIIAAFILLIACINFMNLSTARSEKRAREVGIRKVVGAYRISLIAQFIGESILIATIAFVMALFLAPISLSAFTQLVGEDLTIDFQSPYFWLFSVSFVLFTGLLAGSYPAFYLSSFRPVKVLKRAFTQAGALITVRKTLVVLQFSFAILLIICTLIIQQQIRFGMNRDAGYNRDQLVMVPTDGEAATHYDAIKRELLGSGAAIAVAQTPGPITEHWSDASGYHWPGSTKADEDVDFLTFATKSDFVKTMGITLLQGRDIDIDRYKSDSTALLLNESAARAMHLKIPTGQLVSQGNGQPFHVVGIFKDFILESPFTKQIAPMMIQGPHWADFNVAHIRLNPVNGTAAGLAMVEKIFHTYNPAYPFEYHFVDEAYGAKFKAEQQMNKLSGLFAALTIFISCLGLFALAAYTAENRIREIGVRKILGASVAGITGLLAKDFIRLVLIAFLIAAPISWLIMNKWLLNYGYRINIGWEVFVASGLLALIIAAITVSYQAINAAIANPVKSLRSE